MNYTVVLILSVGIIALAATAWRPNLVTTLFSFFVRHPAGVSKSLPLNFEVAFLARHHHREPRKSEPPPWLNYLVRIVLTAILLMACLYVILLGKYYDEGTRNFSFGTIGTIIGFWLRPPG